MTVDRNTEEINITIKPNKLAVVAIAVGTVTVMNGVALYNAARALKLMRRGY
jgi:hypothetical protein